MKNNTMDKHHKTHKELMIIATLLFVAISIVLVLFTETSSTITGNAVVQTSLKIINSTTTTTLSSGGGSGGSSSASAQELTEMECGEWSECVDGEKTRNCSYGSGSEIITQTITCIMPEEFTNMTNESEFPEETLPKMTDEDYVDVRIKGLDGNNLNSITEEWKNLGWDDILIRVSCDEQIIYFSDGAVIYNPRNDLLRELLPSSTYEQYMNCFGEEKEPEEDQTKKKYRATNISENSMNNINRAVYTITFNIFNKIIFQ